MSFVAALFQSICRKGKGFIYQDRIQQFELLIGIDAAGTDTDDLIDIVLAKQFMRIDTDRTDPHARSHYGYFFSLVFSGIAEHISYRIELINIIKKFLCKVLRSERIAGHQYRLGDLPFLCAVMCSRHSSSS